MFDWLCRKPPSPDKVLEDLNTLFAQLVLLGHLEEPSPQVPLIRTWKIKPYPTKDGYHVHRWDHCGPGLKGTHYHLALRSDKKMLYVSGPEHQTSQAVWVTEAIGSHAPIETILATPLKKLIKGFKRYNPTKEVPLLIRVFFEHREPTDLPTRACVPKLPR